MKFANFLLYITSNLSRKIPNFHGNGKIVQFVNSLYTHRLNTDAIKIAPMKNGTSMKVDLRSGSEFKAYYCGSYDEDLLLSVINLFDKNQVFLDVGGNIGFYSIAIAHSIKTKKGLGSVFTFEPLKGNYQRIKDNVALNSLNKICFVNNFGLSDKLRQAKISLTSDYLTGSNTGNAAILNNKKLDIKFKKITVKLKSLDKIVKKLPLKNRKIDLIKVDIEGHEDYFMRGAKETLRTHRPIILIEINKPYFESRKENLDEIFLPIMPPNYKIFRFNNKQWVQIKSLNECNWLENVFLIPKERLSQGLCKEVFAP
jgi:FkbM family methyltransferase